MKKTLLMQAALTAFVLPAIGQEITEDDLLVEEKIIVTLPGPSREADELIGNATILEKDELVQRLEPSLGNTLAKEPGVSTTFFGPAASRPVVRGLGAERVLVLTNSLGVIDASAASPDHQVTGDAIDAVRIEVLRGPAALAYGGQAVGGVVNVIDHLIAEDIPDAPNGEALIAYSDVYDGSELAARGEFAAGPFVFNLSGSFRDGDDYAIPGFAESGYLHALEEAEHHEDEHEDEDHDDDDHDDDHEEDHEDEVSGVVENSFFETSTLSGGAAWVGDNAFLGVAVRHTNSEYGLPGHSHAHAHEHEEEEGEEDHEDEHEEEHGEESPFIDLTQTRYDIRGGLHFHGSTIDRINGAVSFVDYEHTEFEAPGEPGTIFTSSGHEARIEATHKSILGFKGAFGLQQSKKDLDASGDEAFITPTETERFALFIYETREFSDAIGIEGGARFENVKLTNAVAGDREFDTYSGSLGVHGHPSEPLFLGLQVAYTQRAPTDTELFANGPHLASGQFEVGNSASDVETAVNVEGTIRFTFDQLTIGANVFATRFDDFIYLSPDGTEEDELPVFRFTQDDATFFGGELYVNADFGTYLGAEWEGTASLDIVDGNISKGGGPVPLQPPTALRVGTDADWGKFAAGFDVTFAGKQTAVAASELPTDSYALLNLRTEYDISELVGPLGEGSNFFLEARNVTDEEARISTSVLKDVAPLPGRNIRAGLRLTF